MNNREIFDKVKTHLLTQNRKSYDDYKGCSYRGPNGTMCAVGCLIPDNVYNEDMEGGDVYSHNVQPYLETLGLASPSALRLLRDLQNLHDSVDCEDWPARLDVIEKEYGL